GPLSRCHCADDGRQERYRQSRSVPAALAGGWRGAAGVWDHVRRSGSFAARPARGKDARSRFRRLERSARGVPQHPRLQLTHDLPAPRNSGTADLVAGAVGGLFAPVATFWLGIPFWISVPLAVLVFFGVRLVFAPRQLFEGFRFQEADQASLALAREVLEQAHTDLGALAEAAAAVKDEGVRN